MNRRNIPSIPESLLSQAESPWCTGSNAHISAMMQVSSNEKSFVTTGSHICLHGYCIVAGHYLITLEIFFQRQSNLKEHTHLFMSSNAMSQHESQSIFLPPGSILPSLQQWRIPIDNHYKVPQIVILSDDRFARRAWRWGWFNMSLCIRCKVVRADGPRRSRG